MRKIAALCAVLAAAALGACGGADGGDADAEDVSTHGYPDDHDELMFCGTDDSFGPVGRPPPTPDLWKKAGDLLRVAEIEPAAGWSPALAGSALELSHDGRLAFVADADNRSLAVLDLVKRRHEVSVPLGGLPGDLVAAPDGTVFVAVRDTDEVAVVRRGEVVERLPMPTEPFGVALSPDAGVLYVSSIAAQRLTGWSLSTGEATLSMQLGTDPRGVTVTPDGGRVLVSHVAPGRLSEVRVRPVLGEPRVWERRLSHHDPSPNGILTVTGLEAGFAWTSVVRPDAEKVFVPHLAVNPAAGDSPSARFAAAYYGDALAPPMKPTVSTFDSDLFLSLEELAEAEDAEFGFGAAVTPGEAAIAVTAPHVRASNLPRAAAHHPTQSVMYVVMQGSDNVLAYNTASRVPAYSVLWSEWVGGGPKGVAVSPDGALLWILDEFRREVVRMDLSSRRLLPGVKLPDSVLPSRVLKGRRFFHAAANDKIVGATHVICAGCHIEGRTDRVVWAFGGQPRNAPALTGRLEDTSPYNWTGDMIELPRNIARSIVRMGGLNPPAEAGDAIQAYLLGGLPPLRADLDHVGAALADGSLERGRRMFVEQGCAACHSGAKLTDQKQHRLLDGVLHFDTPSLLGLAATAPYFHDGRYETVREVMRDRYNGMGDLTWLPSAELDDLEAYLLSL